MGVAEDSRFLASRGVTMCLTVGIYPRRLSPRVRQRARAFLKNAKGWATRFYF
jgi:hypothetical protein